jgi:hypothetical protein
VVIFKGVLIFGLLSQTVRVGSNFAKIEKSRNKTFYDRRTLLSNCDDININIETLLFGNDKYSYGVNSKIFGKVRTFINQSKRF